MNPEIGRDRVRKITNQFSDFRVAVIGDLILDRYIWGHATRISPEAPVPIVKVDRKTSALGGAANVLRNISSLGAKPLALGVIGDDKAGRDIVRLCEKWDIDPSGIVVDGERNTTVKTRLIADNQQVVRVDDEKDSAIPSELALALSSRVSSLIQSGLDAVIIEDYNKGVISDFVIGELQSQLNSRNIPIALDPHPMNPLNVKGVKLFTPNRAEAFSLAGAIYAATILPLEDDHNLNDVGRTLMERWSPQFLLVTLGSDGMALFERDAKPIHIPTAAKEVYDVSGAGDTVIATFTTALLAGATALEAAALANHAAGMVVGKVGTVSIDVAGLVKSFTQK